ncbi:MAG: hypothetical protein GWP91_05555 [Rhodobacterales bacterium]|nr:hypothetical protein [Rhodobacterales bacterium]
MWFAALILGWAVLLLLVGLLQQSHSLAMVAGGSCPRCQNILEDLPTPAEAGTYEIAVCPTCDLAISTVQGMAGRATWCPKCRNRTLELTVQRLAPLPPAMLRVRVTEACHLCNHHAIHLIDESPLTQGKGQVIPFPKRGDHP